jgi:arylformamidase
MNRTLLFVVLASVLAECWLTCAAASDSAVSENATPGATATTFEQQSFRDIAYYDGPDADPVRHKLDVHIPKGHKDFPVLFFVHGGGWTKGSKDQLGIYSILARAFNRHGIGVVCPNYRLSPEATHPEHIRDVARAFAWTYKNIYRYGGRNDELFVSGHSAGGHLCALLATDATYLKAQGLSLGAIKGVMPLSGLFIIPEEPIFDVPFGKDPSVRRHASPINHVAAGLPPFLIMYGDHDLPSCDRPGAEAFGKALRSSGCWAEVCEIRERNHFSILWSAISDTDPVTQSMLSFIMARVTLDRIGQDGPDALEAFGAYLARYMGYVGRIGGQGKKE